MNQEAKQEQIKDASALAYTHIRLSGLYKEISNDQWDVLAEEWGKGIVNLLETFTDAWFTKLEAAKNDAGVQR
jgi:hypothetical protein